MGEIKNLSIDLETYSDVDLPKCGVYKYAETPNFEILLFAYSVNGGEVQVADLASGEKIPPEILSAITDNSITKWAFNANFERVCLSKYLGLPQGEYLSPDSWKCTMTWAAYLGLPLSLEGAGAVLGLEQQKLKEGKDLIRYFCVPCSPTQTNGGRTRNLPIHAPEKWRLFKSYNKRDVEVEMAIQSRLSKFPVPESVWEEYHLDQRINDRGIGLDMKLVRNAIAFDERSRNSLTEELRKLTNLDNPNSVSQMKQWLSENGLQTETLGKKAVAELIKSAPAELQQVLMLRQQLAKSSVKKYTAMENAVCKDNRARGMFKFYGANRTGRWAGKNVQLQNLPQNHIPDLEQARELVKCGDYTALEMLYEDIPDTLSQLIRTAFVPQNGCKFIVADFSAIEARVLSWLSGEKWRSEVFRTGGDIYCASASQMFGVPVEKHGVNGHLRQKGKQAELACIAEGQLVLTDIGLVPIQKVTRKMKLWDGENWVSHDGVIFKGKGEVISYDGLTATPDHFVWVEGKPEPIQFGEAASCGAHLVQTGDGWKAIRVGENNKPRETMEQGDEPLLRSNRMPKLRKYTMAKSKQFKQRKIKRVSTMLTAKDTSQMVRKAFGFGKATMRKSKQFGISELRSQRNTLRLPQHKRSWTLSDIRVWLTGQDNGNRPNRHKWKLCQGKSTTCNSVGKPIKQKGFCVESVRTEILAVQPSCCRTQTFCGVKPGEDNTGCRKSRTQQKKELENHIRTTRLYDIRNAGRHHRFTVSGKLVHNCGYGGSVGALKAMGALEMGLAEDELQPLVDSWRTANPNIVQFWWAVDRCVKETVKMRTPTKTHGIKFIYQSGILFIELPSGRRLSYIKPRIGENRFGGESVTYEGIGATKKWERLESYGPKFVENIVQAISRDILCYAMKNLSERWGIVAHVHDEVIIECDRSTSLAEVCEVMGRTPPYASGLLLRADGYECDFYKKD